MRTRLTFIDKSVVLHDDKSLQKIHYSLIKRRLLSWFALSIALGGGFQLCQILPV